MKIINVSQATETEAWLDERMGRITGTKSGGLALEHYAQTDVQKLVEYRDKALEQVCSAHAEVIPHAHSIIPNWDGLLRTRGGDPWCPISPSPTN